MSDRSFDRAVTDWLESGSDRTAPAAIDAVLLAVKTTPQERDLRIPRRFPHMPAFNRASLVAAVVLVAVVGVGGALYLTSPSIGGPGGQTTLPSTTRAPSVAPTQTLPSGIAGWKTYNSEIHGLTVGYPSDWSVKAPASREWQPGNDFPADDLPYADTFLSPGEGDASIGLFLWEMPRGEESSDWFTAAGLKAWADTFCNEVVASACDTFTQAAVPMCVALVIDPGVVECDAALLVPTAEAQYAFFADRGSLLLGDDPRVTVVVVAREDSFPSAARYGGSVELLKAILTTMNVWTPGQEMNAAGAR